MLPSQADLEDGFRTLMLQKKERMPQHFDVGEESGHVADLISSPELRSAMEQYDDLRPEGAGGSGIVLSGVFRPFETRRAIKLPRRRAFVDPEASAEAPRANPELDALAKVSHKHITRLYESISLRHGHCIITEYVPDPRALDEFVRDICCTDECRKDKLALSVALRRVATVLYGVVDALQYMHDTARLIHFDVKPLNILVPKRDHAFVTDLGFARDLSKYKADDIVEVGFTWKYAHPDLVDPHHGARVSQTAPKSRNVLRGQDLRPALDLFAFGRTVQEILFGLKQEFGLAVGSDYTFAYLHVMSCLCLDGHNSADDRDEEARSFVTDRALAMPRELFEREKLRSFEQVRGALDRLLGMSRVESLIPELDGWADGTINVSDLGITTLTPRMSAVLDHPAVARLGQERQLGMLETVFPTATHTRLQHTLGTFHAAGEYLKALYYDPENPTFRILFSPKSGARLLLCTLVHDLGQSSFGHDLEEVDPEEFSHTAIGEELLDAPELADTQGHSLAQVFASPAPRGWETLSREVLETLQGKTTAAMDGVFRDILDGALDADKLDYLIRDSIECRVAYGHGIDHARFLRSLTTVASEGEDGLLRLAVKRKGAASAEAFAFARYQLYQALYWHHTFRAIKGMLLTAAASAVKRLRSGQMNLTNDRPLRAAYMRFVLGLERSQSRQHSASKGRGKTAKTMEDQLLELLEKPGRPPRQPAHRDDRTLLFLWKLCEGKERCLIEDLTARRYYKRILEIPLADPRGTGQIRPLVDGSKPASMGAETG